MQVRPHERFSSEVTLTPEAVAAFARAVGDQNPWATAYIFLVGTGSTLWRAAHLQRELATGRYETSGAHLEGISIQWGARWTDRFPCPRAFYPQMDGD